jgi:hypothetical protein
MAVYNSIMIPLKVAFEPKLLATLLFRGFDALIDFCFVVDIIISFRTTYYDETGLEIDDTILISRNYFYG